MSLELWSTIASVGTFVVIGATAIAALIQLRHMRSNNQIAAITEIRETLESEKFTIARHFVSAEIPKLIADPAGRQKLGALPLPLELEPVRTLANFFETMGCFVKFGIIDKTLACDLWSGVVVDIWKYLEPVVLIRRAIINRGVWTNFEYLTVLSEEWTSKNPSGNYPANVRCMKYDERSLAAAAAVAQDLANEGEAPSAP